jgi:hypothetical protein
MVTVTVMVTVTDCVTEGNGFIEYSGNAVFDTDYDSCDCDRDRNYGTLRSHKDTVTVTMAASTVILHACMHACMHVCMYACMHVCMYACMHACMYA